MALDELPHGRITFLLTDVEGSTRLWEEHPSEMTLTLARHDALVREVVVVHCGTLIKERGEGDSTFSVFSRASAAVSCALDIQRRLASEPWPSETPLRVRIAVHTGECAVRDGDYFGPVVNRCARLRAVCHGGQIIVSEATARETEAVALGGAILVDLGVHRLRDLERPERVFQLCHADLPGGFPPLRSLTAVTNNLPVQVTSLVGRAADVAEVQRMLTRSRLLTLVGAGGVGKTRLALQVAAEMLDAHADGVWFVDLSVLTDGHLIPKAILRALSAREEPGRSATETLLEMLRETCLLIVLDNCEHLVDDVADLVREILSCPRVRLLATSREPLGVPGEQSWRVPSLELPAADAATPETLERVASVQLFTDRASLARPDLRLGPQELGAVASICRRLDGIPLAIELAASRVGTLTPTQIDARLDDRFRFLGTGTRATASRQRTLRAMVEWSHDLLREGERVTLRRLAVFAGAFQLEAAEWVGAGQPLDPGDVIDLLSGLVDRSMVTVVDVDGEQRYRLLETIRHYALEKLAEATETDAVRARHLGYFADVGQEAIDGLQGGDQSVWLARLDADLDDLRSALEWGIASPAEGDAALGLARALSHFFVLRGFLSEGRLWLERALRREAGSRRDRGLALAAYGFVALSQGDHEVAERALDDALAIGVACDDAVVLETARYHQAGLLTRRGDYEGARALHEGLLELERARGNDYGIAGALLGIGGIDQLRCDLPAARRMYEEALTILRRLGNRGGLAIAVYNLGAVLLDLGDRGAARAAVEESLAIRREIGDQRGIAGSLGALGECARHDGRVDDAVALLCESIEIGYRIGDHSWLVYCFEMLGCAIARSDSLRAARLFAAAHAMRERMRLAPGATEHKEVDRHLTIAREHADPEAFERARQDGLVLGVQDAVECALGSGARADR